ncbi:MAG: helix-turn-helix domain-containing protein [Acidimicrobiales bacterium]
MRRVLGGLLGHLRHVARAGSRLLRCHCPPSIEPRWNYPGANGGNRTSAGTFKPTRVLPEVADVAKYLGLQPHTVYRLINEGKLRAEGRSIMALRADGTLARRRAQTRVKAADLQTFIDASRLKPGELSHLFKALD